MNFKSNRKATFRKFSRRDSDEKSIGIHMKKLIWSGFALSLLFSTPQLHAKMSEEDIFWEEDQKIMPAVQGYESEIQLEKEVNLVSKNEVEVDLPAPKKGQNHSIIPWSTLDPEEWLSIKNWMIERNVKDQLPHWKINLRHAVHKELFGKVLQCKGSCSVYRGNSSTKVQHLSRIHEGDEFRTESDSVAWIYLMDGSLLRVSPNSSISFHEINFSSQEILIVTRLSEGHVFWHPREKREFVNENAPETDSISLPLMVQNSNVEFFERRIYSASNDKKRLKEIMDLEDNAVNDQLKFLNDLKMENDLTLNIPSKFFIISPNATIVSKQMGLDFVYVLGGESYFKKRSSLSDEHFTLTLRGYLNLENQKIIDNDWYRIDSDGKSFHKMEEVPGILQVLELITKRIKTIETAREIWVKSFTVPIIKTLNDPQKMAIEYGYSIWDEDLQKRLAFLMDYTRRIETTNLNSIHKLLTKLKAEGKIDDLKLSESLYISSLNHYLLGLKSRYDSKRMRVRDMNDLHYYVWLLRNGKF